jgi:hypothetical protein
MIGLLIDTWNWLGLQMGEILGSRTLPLLLALLLNAYGSALIIMSGIGLRVVDLVALTLVSHLGTRFYMAKLALEAGFLLAGFLLGGPVGIAAVAFVCVVGPFTEPLIWGKPAFPQAAGLWPAPGNEPRLSTDRRVAWAVMAGPARPAQPGSPSRSIRATASKASR